MMTRGTPMTQETHHGVYHLGRATELLLAVRKGALRSLVASASHRVVFVLPGRQMEGWG